MDALNQTFLDVQREATWALGNLTAGGNPEQLEFLVDAGGVSAFLKVLAGGEASLITVALDSLNNMLKCLDLKEKVKEQVVSGKGVERLEVLQQFVNTGISDKATQILKTYFQEDEAPCQSEEEDLGGESGDEK
ncbi:importin subunit alpha-6-like [Homarus americanus]|uniref:importin subunit alpha-6-like n=1 Tax=Homarus americanus TaxID=6706 RepID=UPI001C47939E|nr:importin subunit alpha-6-like [Homarus americanus]